jgi:hypothetical protein
MQNDETHYSNTTTGVTIVTSSLLPGAAEQCALRERGHDRCNLMLFGGGAASLFALQMTEPSDPIAEALGRVLARHSFRHAPPSPDLIRDIRGQAMPVCEDLAWSDLAVEVCPPRAVGNIVCHPLSCGAIVALVLATHDPHMPITQVICSTDAVPRPLLIAIGRTVVGHHGFLI